MSNLQERIERFERNLAYMSKELDSIKAELGRGVEPEAPVENIVQQPVEQVVPVMPARVPVQKTARPKKEKKSTEQFIGKVAMGIGASVLIFIAMVMFATLIIPMFNDTMKMISMYLLSIILIVLGEVVYKKSKTGYTILSACGVGALFISLVATCVYFHAIGQLFLYLLLLLWVFGVAFHMARNRNMMFAWVGQIGIFIATALSGYAEVYESDFYLMVGFVLIAEAIFFITFHKNSFKISMLNSCSLVASLLLLDTIAYSKTWSFFSSSPTISIGPVLAIVLAGSAVIIGTTAYLYKRSETEGQKLGTRIYSIVTSFMFVLLVGSLNNLVSFSDDWLTLIGIVGMVIAIAVSERFGGENGIIATRTVHIALLSLVIFVLNYDIASITFLILMIGAGVFGLMRREKYYYFLPPVFGLFATWVIYAETRSFWNILSTEIYDTGMQILDAPLRIAVVIISIMFLIAHMILVRVKEGPYTPYEIVSYLVLVFTIPQCVSVIGAFSGFDESVVILCLLVIMQIFVKVFKWMEDTRVPYYIVNACLMFGSLILCEKDFVEVGYRLVVILAAAAVFSLNLRELFSVSKAAGAYVAFKYSILLLVILNSFDASSQVLSIVLLLVAAASIAVGFKINNKSLRLYGLVVSIISVAKLILVDITYDNSLMRACSFLICGLICFAISIVYNRMEKKMLTEVCDEEVSDEE